MPTLSKDQNGAERTKGRIDRGEDIVGFWSAIWSSFFAVGNA